MAKNTMPTGLRTAMFWVLGLGIIALVGLIMVILFGNLYGNVGFDQTSSIFHNDTIADFNSNVATTPESLTDKSRATINSPIIVTNATGGAGSIAEVIDSANYTISGSTIIASADVDAGYNNSVMNISYTGIYDGQGRLDSDNIILNYTQSVTNTSAQFPTIGTIIGIAILLIILLGVLIFAISKMMQVANVSGGGSSSGKFKGSSGEFG